METRTPVIGIVKFKDKILLLKRSLAKKSSPGKYQPVSGFIKEMESCENAVLREIKEETNLNTKIISSGKVFEVTDNYGRWIIVPYLCEAENKKSLKLSDEHTEFVWIKPEEWKKYDCIAGMEQDLRAVGLI